MTATSRRLAGACAVALALTVAACEANKSANPLSPNVAGPIPGVSITPPKVLEPASGTKVAPDAQPLSLLLENATTSGARTLWMEVEAATDLGFTAKVHTSPQIQPGSGGRTTYKLPAALPSGKTYYFRARGADGANTGDWSATSSVDIAVPVVIDVPLPMSPVGGQVTSSNRPELIVATGKVSGTSDVSYRFELSVSNSFATINAALTVPRSLTTTTSVVLGELPYDTTFYWRVSASDGVVTTAYSNVHTFKTPKGASVPTPTPTPTPTSTPPPSGGGPRTPDPPAGQRLPLPNMSRIVEEVARDYPNAVRNSCQEHGGTWEFMDRLVDRLRQYDTRWGYNCKRGNCNDPSYDVVDYNYGSGRDEGTTNVYIIDVLGGHCGSNPTPAWIDQTQATVNSGTIGRWTGRGRF
jgi:hypothetical protein